MNLNAKRVGLKIAHEVGDLCTFMVEKGPDTLEPMYASKQVTVWLGGNEYLLVTLNMKVHKCIINDDEKVYIGEENGENTTE